MKILNRFTVEEWEELVDEVIERMTCNRYCPHCISTCHTSEDNKKGSINCQRAVSQNIRILLGGSTQCLGWQSLGNHIQPIMNGYNVYGNADDGIRSITGEKV